MTACEMRISDWSSDVCSSDLIVVLGFPEQAAPDRRLAGQRDVKIDERVGGLARLRLAGRFGVAGLLERLVDVADREAEPSYGPFAQQVRQSVVEGKRESVRGTFGG